jgi:putative DNA primase/helicase
MRLLDALGIQIRLNGRAEQRVPCPQCGKGARDDALGVNVEDGRYHCFRCGWKGRAGGETAAPARPIARIDDPSVAERKRERLRTTVRETVALDHPKAHAVRRYLESRALGEILRAAPKVLRAHPALEYWDVTRSLGRYPAMVGLFHDSAGKVITLHATYLRQDGCAKASVPHPKKILGVVEHGATKGGAIRLFDARGPTLGIAEGIESALSLHLIRKIPTWAARCADNLECVRLPEGLRQLEIGVDMDASGKGQAVAEALAKRVMRWSPRTLVLYIKPELDGPGDLNDELRRRAG